MAVENSGKAEKGYKTGKNFHIVFNNEGNIIEKTEYGNDPYSINRFGDEQSDHYFDKIINEYDRNGNLIEQNWHNPDGYLGKWTGNYDDKGNEIEQISYKSDGSLLDKSTFKYDDKGNRIETLYYKSDNSLDNMKTTSKYNEKRYIIEFNTYHFKTGVNNKNSYQYDFDNEGNWVKKLTLRNDIPQHIVEREIAYF